MIDQNMSRTYGYVSGTADSYTIPRRALDLSDYLDIVRRHIHWILGPAFFGLVLSVVVAFAWPDTYVSEATMRILPPQVPTTLLPSGTTSQLADRITAIQQQVLSRDGLVEIIRTHNLYPEDMKKKPMADIVEMMQQKIAFERSGIARTGAQQGGSLVFRIRYSYSDKYAAQKVVRDIVDKCIRLTNQGQFDRASSTTQFLADQVADAKRELDRIEEELTQFRMANQGRLPDQVDANLTQMRAFQTNLDSTTERMNRFSQERIYLESQLNMLKEQAGRATRNPQATVKNRVKSERLVQSEREIMAMRAQLSALLERYTESHPDVRRLKGQLEVMERLRNQSLAEEEKAEQEPEPAASAESVAASMDPQVERTIAEIESRLNLIDMSIQRDMKRQSTLQDQISNFASRIESRPMVEQQYITLTRDYTLAKTRYNDLAQKRSVSEMMTDLENRKQSELLEMLDQPSLPQRATDPNRLMIVGVGMALGMFAGVLLVGVREIKDGSLKNLKDVRLYSNMAVLGSIPLLENDLVVRRKRRLMFLAWATALLLGIAAMAASMYYYYFIAQR
jgi:uncharacterized protein involved in exopolysaccharide biosynthesis